MSRTLVNFLLDTVLLAAFVLLVWCSVVVRFVFPPGPSAAGWKLWGYDFDQWAGLQFGLVAALLAGIVLHVMLHWSWVCGVLANRLSRDRKSRIDEGLQTIYGVGLLIAVFVAIGVGVAAAALGMRQPHE
jgi:hypothetical protein